MIRSRTLFETTNVVIRAIEDAILEEVAPIEVEWGNQEGYVASLMALATVSGALICEISGDRENDVAHFFKIMKNSIAHHDLTVSRRRVLQ